MNARVKISPEDREALLDAVLDLQHDLGKHLHVPVAWLPPDATHADVRRAARTALHETRRGPDGPRSARRIWSEFRLEVGDALTGRRAWAPMEKAVMRALDWTGRLDTPSIDRAALQGDLAAVGPAIRALVAELKDG